MSIPVICLASDSVSAFDTFNPNDWSGQSRAIVHSCAATAGVMKHNVQKIRKLCLTGKEVCCPRFEDLVASMGEPRNVVGQIRAFAQVPELHSAIVCFLVNAKTVLDFLAQLVCVEGVVNARLDGFHKKGSRLLSGLERNVPKGKEEDAKALANLIQSHKERWIDGLIGVRDELTHPEKGVLQLMFEMQIDTNADGPVLTGVIPPKAGDQPIDQYAGDVERRLREFARRMLDCLAKSKA